MTYGEITSRLRDQLTWLLERHRIGQQLGGPGSFRIPVTTTETERAVLGQEIQRYRDAVLTYCLEAVQTATPLDGNHRRDPAAVLRRRLEVSRRALPAGQSLSSLLDRRPKFGLVARWQDAARAAVQGERELAALAQAVLSPQQQQVVLRDTADLVRGLVVLNNRYRSVPGWVHLEQRGHLLTASDAAAWHLAGGGSDPSVDHLGWHPAPGIIEGPALPGIAGVVQAQHNVVVDLTHFPSAYNLRQVLVGQASLAIKTARFAQSVESPTAATFEERAALYRQLLVASRSVGGVLGGGRDAALESANAARRISFGPATDEDTRGALEHLIHLNQRVDGKIAAAFEHGFRKQLYLTVIKLPAMETPGPDGIARAATKYIPADSTIQAGLLALVRNELRPLTATNMAATSNPSISRAAFRATLAMEGILKLHQRPCP